MSDGASEGASSRASVQASESPLRLTERLGFGFEAPLARAEALAFVRDVLRSLAVDDLLEGLRVVPGDPVMVSAQLPVATPLFGRRELPFRSVLESTPDGARLLPAAVVTESRGWAEVRGEATVSSSTVSSSTVSPSAVSSSKEADDAASRIDYLLDITILLDLPAADRWGTRALRKMIELTARSVLQRLVESLPAAVEAAALGASLEARAAQPSPRPAAAPGGSARES